MSDQEINLNIANNICDLLERRNRTQLELAEYMGVSQATVSNWCKGAKLPRMDKIDRICTYFDVERTELFSKNFKDTYSDDSMLMSARVAQSPELKQLISFYEASDNIGQKKIMEFCEDVSKLYPRK